MTTFSALNTALTALNASRRGMDVSGKNIANANTDGYSRQRVNFEARGASVAPALHSVSLGDGGGVDAVSVDRLRDALLEVRAQTEHGRRESLATQKDTLAGVEQLFGEPGETGLQSQLADFWNGWHDVANRPGDLAARSQLLQRAGTVAEGFNQLSSALDTTWRNDQERLGTLVDEVNTAAKNVAELNQAIQRAEVAGLPPGELSDQRDVLVMRLADLTGARTRPGDSGQVDVYLGNKALVRGSASADLRLGGATALTGVAGSPVELQWAADGSPAAVSGGVTAAMADTLNTTLPGYRTRLDRVATALATAVNTQHAAGYDLSGTAGAAFFSGTGAGAIQVAAAATPGGNLDSANADALAGLARLPGSADAVYRQLVVDLGVEAQTANRRAEIQDVVTTQVDAARDAVAGVDLDEEMTNLIQFQHAYSGAARLMTAVDEMIDTLINKTGLVGR
jgi:flagellar hook-associated protein 1 FlgK